VVISLRRYILGFGGFVLFFKPSNTNEHTALFLSLHTCKNTRIKFREKKRKKKDTKCANYKGLQLLSRADTELKQA